jgi:Caspase domain
MKIKVLPILFYCISLQVLCAQHLEVAWRIDLPSGGAEQFADWTRTRDNRLAVATHSQFRLLDITTDTATVRQTTPLSGTAKSMANLHDDGSYWIVGEKPASKNASSPLLLRLDESGTNLGEVTPLKAADQQFEQIIFLPNGKGYLVSSTPDGDFWLRAIENKKIGVPTQIKNDALGRLVRVFPKPYTDNEWWLTGETRKRDGFPKGNVLALGFKHNVLDNRTQLGNPKILEYLSDALFLPDEQLLCVGEREGDGPWYGKVADAEGNADFSKHFGEAVVAAAPAGTSGDCLMLLANSTSQRSIHRLAWYSEQLGASDTLHSLTLYRDRVSDYADARLLEWDAGFWLLIGTVRDAQKQPMVRLYGIKDVDNGKGARGKGKSGKTAKPAAESQIKGASSGYRLELVALKWEKDNLSEGNTVRPDEKIRIRVSLQNKGPEPMPSRAQVKISLTEQDKGLRLITNQTSFEALPVGKTGFFTVEMAANAELQSGNSELNIQVQVGNEQKWTHQATIQRQAPNLAITSETGRNPLAIERGSGLILNGDKLTIKFMITTPKGTEPNMNNLSRVDNGKPAPRGKDNERLKKEGKDLGNQVLTTFEWEAPLKPGRNVFRIAYESSEDSVVYHFDALPNAYVLGIGIDYIGNTSLTTLKWPQNDVRAFVSNLVGQAGKGLFGQVFVVDTLVRQPQTERAQIETAIERLSDNKYLNGRPLPEPIRPYDYVFIFISAHGDTFNIGNQTHFGILAQNYRQNNTLGVVDFNYLLARYLKNIEAHKIIFLDACHSGAGKGATNANEARSSAIEAAFKSLPQSIVFASSKANETSYEIDKPDSERRFGKQGVFTYALLEAFQNKTVMLQDKTKLSPDQNQNGYLTPDELFSFLQKRVPDLGPQTAHPPQNPTLTRTQDNAQPSFSILKLPPKP